MPGLIGVLRTDDTNSDVARLLNGMCGVMKHESWYKLDMFVDESVGIGRLSLGTLNPETQPIFNENKTLCIMMDGEVYDYQNLKQELISKGHKFLIDNNPEFIIHLYEEYGNDFVHKLNGAFALAIWNRPKQEVLIVNDRYGLRPLYYAKHDGRLLFASEVKAILQDKAFKRVVDDAAVAEFFAFEHLLGNKTFFKGISVLPPASILACHKDKFSIEHYWDFNYEEKAFSENYYVEQLVKRFKKAVSIRMQDEHKKGLLLSGGLDSRSILAAAGGKLDTFTFGVKGSREAKIARIVANTLDAKNEFFELEQDYIARHTEKAAYLTDGMVNILHFHVISLLDRIRDGVDIIFDGLAFDLLLGGSFLTSQIVRSSNDELPTVLFGKTNTLFRENIARQLFVKDYYQKIKDVPLQSLGKELEQIRDENPSNRSDYFFMQNRERRQTFMGPLYYRSKLEYRAPTYDNDLVDLILTIPSRLRCNHRIYNKFLKQLCPTAARVPYNKTGIRVDAPRVLSAIGYLIYGGKIVSKRLLRRYTHGLVSIPNKSSYPDYDEWMRKDISFREFVKEILLDERTLNRGYFNKDFVRKLIDDHMNYRRDYARQICALITFELWHRQFMD